ncbi:MAG: RHS repeat protein [Planctomycetaceae bacterium]|nr:RHS repeat protein [Planctomycetaceae bacterium]
MFTSVYDDDGQLTKLSKPEGEVTSFSFDAGCHGSVSRVNRSLTK